MLLLGPFAMVDPDVAWAVLDSIRPLYLCKGNKTMAMNATKTKWICLGVLWVAVGLTWVARREVPLDVVAQRSLDAMMAANGSALERLAFEEELAANPELNADRLELIYRQLVLPRIALLKQTSKVVTQDNVDSGIAQFELETKYGFRVPMAASVYKTGGEAKCPVLRTLYGAWIMEYYSKRDIPFTLLHRNEAVLAGIRTDREVLRSAGVRALSEVSIQTGTVVMTEIDDLVKRYEAWNKDLAAKQHEAEPLAKSNP